jgi:hypothetical protein
MASCSSTLAPTSALEGGVSPTAAAYKEALEDAEHQRDVQGGEGHSGKCKARAAFDKGASKPLTRRRGVDSTFETEGRAVRSAR